MTGLDIFNLCAARSKVDGQAQWKEERLCWCHLRVCRAHHASLW